MDNAGALIERVSYDPYGRPTIEAGDADPPQVSSIERQANGDLLVAFTEAVLPPPSTTAGTTIVNSLASLSGAVTLLRDVSGTMTAVAGSWSYEEAATGFDHGTVLRFVPGESLAAGSAAALSVNAGGLIDSWSNAATAVTLNFNIGAGVLYTGPPQGSTSTPVVERSLVGNGLMFQAHLWDADAGLYLARARVLDPGTGTFLQRDRTFADSVNLYAFAASDPINQRDPSGRAVWKPREHEPAGPFAKRIAAEIRAGKLFCGGIACIANPAAMAINMAVDMLADSIDPPPPPPPDVQMLAMMLGVGMVMNPVAGAGAVGADLLSQEIPISARAVMQGAAGAPMEAAEVMLARAPAAAVAEGGTAVQSAASTAPVEAAPAGPVAPYSRSLYGGSRTTRNPVASALREAGEGQPCPTCGNAQVSGTARAPSPEHQPALVEHYYQHGGANMTQAEREAYAQSAEAFSGTQCRTCQNAQGGTLSAFSRWWKDFWGL